MEEATRASAQKLRELRCEASWLFVDLLAAVAFHEMATAVMESWHHQGSAPGRAACVFLALAFVATAVRFTYGNALHLASLCDKEGNGDVWFTDFCVILTESVLLIFLGHACRIDESLLPDPAFLVLGSALLAMDILWVKARNLSPSARMPNAWWRLNLSLLVLIGCALGSSLARALGVVTIVALLLHPWLSRHEPAPPEAAGGPGDAGKKTWLRRAIGGLAWIGAAALAWLLIERSRMTRAWGIPIDVGIMVAMLIHPYFREPRPRDPVSDWARVLHCLALWIAIVSASVITVVYLIADLISPILPDYLQTYPGAYVLPWMACLACLAFWLDVKVDDAFKLMEQDSKRDKLAARLGRYARIFHLEQRGSPAQPG
ncbi:MAG TPA: hypothetical protein VFL36_00980 [Myxococcales bacterium]|nr:hypothetical protein [Myxococcales bacterium]